MLCFPQDMVFGSNELIYVPGSPLPITMEEVEEEEEEADPPSAPPRSKVARTSQHLIPVDFVCDPFLPSPNTENYSAEEPERVTSGHTPLAKPRSKLKSTVSNQKPAFDVPDPVFYAKTENPPETLPRTRRGQKHESSADNEPCSPDGVSPPPRIYATIPRKKPYLVSFTGRIETLTKSTTLKYFVLC